MKPRFSSTASARRKTAFSILAALCAGEALQAVQVTWQGNADTNLNNALNWVGGVAPATNVDGALFDVAGTSGTSLVQNSNIQYTNVGGAITFSANAPAYTISGTGEITVGTGHIVNNSPNPQIINNNLKRNTSNSVTIGASGATLAMNGQYDIRAASLNTVAFGSTSGGNVMFNGNLVNTGAAGTYGVTVTGSGSGTLTLAGNNTVLNGNLTLDDNITVKLASPTAWTGPTAVAGNNSNTAVWLASDAALGTFTLDCSAATATKAHNIILGTASGAAVTNQPLSAITIGQQQGINFLKAGNVTSGTPAASVSGTTTFGMSGSGRTSIISANGVNLSLGAVEVGPSATVNQFLTLDGTTTGSRVTGPISNGSGVGATASLSKAGPGTWTLSGTNTFTGGTVVNNGVLKLDFNAAGAPASDILYNGVAAGTTTLGGGNLSVAGKDNASSTQQLGSFVLLANTANSVTLRAGSGSGTTSVTVTGATINTGCNLDFDLGSGTTFQNTAIAAPAFIGPSVTFGGNEFARYDATGLVVAAVDANYTGVLPVALGGSTSGYYRLDGSLTRDPALDWAFKGIRLTNTGDSDSLDINGGTLTFSNSAIIYKGGSDNNYSINNGTLRSNGTNVQFNVVSGATLTLNADVANNPGASSVGKAGAGTLVVSGAKTYTGATSIMGGIYSIDTIANGAANSGLGASTNVALSLRFSGGTLRYTGGTATTDRSFTVYGPRATIDASGTGALSWAPALALSFANNNNNNPTVTSTNAAQNQTVTFTGTSTADNTFGSALGLLADSAPGRTTITKSGAGKWILNQANTYTGGTRIDGGTLGVANAGALGTYGPVSFGGGTLQYETGITTDYSYRIQHSTAAIGINTNGNNVAFASGIDESNIGGLSKSGAGTLTLKGLNTYAGDTSINAGTLALADGAQLKFKPAANGVTNTITGTGTANIDGDFVIDLSAAALANGNSWTLVNNGSLAETYGTSFGVVGFTEAADVWTKVDGSNTWTFTEATGVLSLTVTVSNNYASWANDPLKGNIPGEPALGDFDSDGLDNLTEYALGLNPRVSSVPPGTFSGNPGTLAFPKGTDAYTNGDVTWTIEESTNLTAWTPVTPSVDNATTISYTLPASQTKVFARLKVTKTP